MRDRGSAVERAGASPVKALCVSMLCLLTMSACTAKRKTAFEIPEGSAGIVAYGSLISLPSMEQTLGHKYPGPIHQIHLTGFEREWICVRPFNKMEAFILRGNERIPITGAAELNISPKRKGRINAVLYLISDAELRDKTFLFRGEVFSLPFSSESLPPFTKK